MVWLIGTQVSWYTLGIHTCMHLLHYIAICTYYIITLVCTYYIILHHYIGLFDMQVSPTMTYSSRQ